MPAVVLGALILLTFAVIQPGVRAATVTVVGPASCADAGAIAEQTSELLGRPLASVTGVDFEVALSRARSGAWVLHLDTVETTAERSRRSREIRGSQCGELADAAAVGIAMSVRALAAASPAPGPAAPSAVVSSPPPPPPMAVAAPTTPRPALVGRVAVVGDAGALPGPTAGIELAISLRLWAVRLGLSGTALAPRTAHVAGDTGGEVNLVFAAVEICTPSGARRIEVFGCGAFELGRLSAEGVGIMRPRLRSALWEAARAELGLGLTLRPRLVLAFRAGAGVPLARPQFVINGTTPVHRPSGLLARAAAALEFDF